MNERLFHGGTVYTGDASRPLAEAVAVREGTIVAVGSESACRRVLSASYEPVDLKGGTLLPGFCDAHTHPVPTVFYAMNCSLLGVKDLGELVGRLRKSAAGKRPDSWVVGLNFDENGMAEPRLPTRLDLDRVSMDKPVIVLKHDGHSVIANSAAMKAAGITPDTPEPEAGTIDRDERGMPLGIFRELAKPLILDHMTLPAVEELIAGAQKAFGTMLGYGITSLGLILETDDGPSGTLGAFDIPAMELFLPYIRQSICSFLITRDVPLIGKALFSELNDPGKGARIAGLKIMADGTFGSLTAAMEEPFSDHPGNSGLLIHPEDELYRLMDETHAAGLQIAIHAIGDRANRTCIALYERLLKHSPRFGHRHRIEHASIMDEAMLRKVRDLGLVLSVQPMFIHSDMPYLEKRIGKARMHNAYPFQSMIEAGIPLAASSDSPIETQDVMAAVECAVTREGYVPAQALTPKQAIWMYTMGGAWAQREEQVKGSIALGKRADFVLLEENPLRVRPEEIHAVPVLKTFISGELVYSR